LDDNDLRRDIRDTLDELDRFFEDFQKSIQDQIRRTVGDAKSAAAPYVTGFTLRLEPSGKPNIEKFGDNAQTAGFRAPLSEQFVDQKSGVLKAVFDLPGVSKENIEISTTDRNLVVRAQDGSRKYMCEMALRSEVDQESAKADYRNGVLEVSFSLKDKSNKGFRRVKVD